MIEMKKLNIAKGITPFACADAYKLSHWVQYPKGTTMVYSNFTPRKCRIPSVNEFTFFGLQAFLIKLKTSFDIDFFNQPEETAVKEFTDFYSMFFMGADASELGERVRALHQLGYLPLEVRALKEGSIVNHGIPVFTIKNTHPEFYWLTNFVESWMSAEIWHLSTSATTAYLYRKTLNQYAKETSDADFMPAFQGHDFSFRGLEGLDAAMGSGAAHLLSFTGTDTCPALFWINTFYHQDPNDSSLIGTSVPATEHSVMCSGMEDDELETYRRLIEEVYPTGIVSIVSDTWDFWRVITEYLPILKDKIMARNGKIVIRPDSSPKTPVEIICGDPEAPVGSPEYKGLCRCLHEIFGGTINSKGYIDLHPSIGMIYGDSITLHYQQLILKKLAAMGFSSTNIVLGIGSYTYQFATRDTHGIAIKATAVEIDNQLRPISKDPKTDKSGKKSALGLLKITREDGVFKLHENVTQEEADSGELELVFQDGNFKRMMTFTEVRNVLASQF